MIYEEPELQSQDRVVMEMIQSQRQRLRTSTQHSPRKWTGTLRRITFARAIQGSNSIEGYHSSMDEAVAAVDNAPPPDEPTETWYAARGYQQALTCILQAAQDTSFEHSKQLLKALQFMMTSHDMARANPGQFRPGPMFVVDSATGEQVYEAPEVETVNGLMDELIDYLRKGSVESELVTGAMAHLNLTMVHPFRDGNGRMARALQTLVLALEGHFDPVFSSIEEWLGNNSSAYYKILSDVGHGVWRPVGDALPWVRFCLRAHHQQAARHIRRNEEYGRLYERIDAIAQREGLHERIALPLFDVALGLNLTNTKYRTQTGESYFTRHSGSENTSTTGHFRCKEPGPGSAIRGRRGTAKGSRRNAHTQAPCGPLRRIEPQALAKFVFVNYTIHKQFWGGLRFG